MNRQLYSANVVDNQDPEFRGRIRVTCRSLVGQDAQEVDLQLPYWVEPAHFCASSELDVESGVGAGIFFVPEVGSRVILEVIISDPRYDGVRGEALILHPQPKYYAAPFSPVFAVPVDFTDAAKYPRVRGMRTPGGHTVLFDDNQGAETITIRHQNTETLMTMTPEGTMTIQANASCYVTILKDGTMTLHAPNIKLDAAATQAIVRGNDLLTWLNSTLKVWLNQHIHPTGVGPSGPPTVLAQDTPSSVLSSKHKVD